MKSTKIAVVYLVSLLALAGSSQAQIDCDEIEPWPSDTVKVVPTTGKPGDTISVPIYFGNSLTVAGFQVYMEFDSTLIKPVLLWVDEVIDTAIIWENCRDTIIGQDTTVICDSVGVSIDTLLSTGYDFDPLPRWDTTATLVEQVVGEIDFPSGTPSIQRIQAVALPDYNYLRVAIDTGFGNVMMIPFVIDSSAAHGTLTQIDFYEETVYRTDTFPPIPIGCLFSQYSDIDGIAVKFTPIRGTIKVDTAYVPGDLPVVNSFYPSPSQINPGDSTRLFWNVSRATSIFINPEIGQVTDSIGFAWVHPSITTEYTLTAVNSEGTDDSTTIVTVLGGNNPPVFTEPTQTSYEIDQGQTLAFQVTATDADDDVITLSPTALPNNATFGPTNPVVGTGTVTGNFSFTPDFSQKGIYQVTFSANDGNPGGNTLLTVTIDVKELPFDRLFTTSAEDQAPVGGLPGTREILLPINLITAQTVYGVQFDFLYDEEYFQVDSIITTPRTQDYVIYENIGEIPGEVRVVTFGLSNEPIVMDSNTAILYVVMSIDSTATPGDYPILIEDGWESVNPDPDFPSLMLVTDSGIIQVDRLGDVNLDKRIDVADAVNIVGYILENYGFNPRQFAAADVVTDSTINVLDLVGIINLIFGIPPSPTAGYYISSEMATVSLDYPDLAGGTADVMVVRSELPEQIAGVQLEIRYDPSAVSLGKPSLGGDASKMVLSSKDNGNGKLTVLLYFKNPFRTEDLIQVGQADLVNVPIIALTDVEVEDKSQMKLTRALLSTASAEAVRVEGMDLPLPSTFVLHQNYPNPFNPTTTIEFSLGGAGDGSLTQHVTLDIYNILGQHVKTLMDDEMLPGNYQVEWNATNTSGNRIATGIYLYRLQVDKESKSKKMLLLK